MKKLLIILMMLFCLSCAHVQERNDPDLTLYIPSPSTTWEVWDWFLLIWGYSGK